MCRGVNDLTFKNRIMLASIASAFRRISWIVIAIGFLHVSHVELGYPPDKEPWKPRPPRSEQRWQYVRLFLVGLPGAGWAIVRACRDQQRTPWE